MFIRKDPKTIRDEVKKLVDKEKDDESNEKLTKIIKSLIFNIRATMAGSPGSLTVLINSVNKQQPVQKASEMSASDLHIAVHNYLNFLVSLSYIGLKRAQLFLNESLIEVNTNDLI